MEKHSMTNTKRFVSHVRNHLKEYGFVLIFGKGRQVNISSSRCEGYFSDSPNREIRVARAGSGWLGILAHEYCHFLQWLEKPQYILTSEDSAGVIVHNISIGQLVDNYSDCKIDKAFLRIAEMERDCEKRTVALIKHWKLPINKDMYIRQANLYIYLHHMWKEYKTRKTCFNPNVSKRVLSNMPKTFKAKSHLILPRRVERELARCFINP